jgi:hypothetical protein
VRTLKSEALARGSLELLWDTVYENGDEFLGDSSDVESAARWDGEPGQLTAALRAAGGEGFPGFIEELPENAGLYRVHDLFENAPEYVQKRMQREVERKRRGVTISDLRREAGKRGRALQLSGQTAASVEQTADSCPNPRANVGQVSGNCRANGDTPAPAPAPLKPLSELLSSDQEQPRKSNSKPSHEAEKLAALLASEIRRNKPDYRIKPSQERQWAMTADRMLRLDGRQPEQIAELIRWAQRDEFWCSNILSMEKLREKFDQLEMRRGLNGSRAAPSQVKPFDLVAKSLAQLAGED